MHNERYVGEGAGPALVGAGTEIAGATAGAAVGLLFAGPVGSLAGAAAGPILSRTLGRVASEFGERVLGRRERVRAGAAVAFAAERLESLLANGAIIRDDGFFTDLPDGRNQAREVAEGVLLAARSAFEERKVRHIGCLFANVATLPEIDSGLASLALRRAEDLTWRQYAVLAAVHRRESLPLPASQLNDNPGEWTPWGVRREFADLYEAGYFSSEAKKTQRLSLRYPNTTLQDQRLAHQGRLMHELLSLDLINDEDVMEIHEALSKIRGPD